MRTIFGFIIGIVGILFLVDVIDKENASMIYWLLGLFFYGGGAFILGEATEKWFGEN